MEDKPLRDFFLSIKGIGEETADSIMLYVFKRPFFVVDTYTKRFLLRHGVIDFSYKYEDIQMLFHKKVEKNTEVYNEFHALFVRLGKEHCRSYPVCFNCPLSCFF